MPDYSETKIQFRRGTASEWSSENPTLGIGEPGFDTTNKLLKIGDGSTAWASLSGINANNSAFSYTTDEITGLTGGVDDWLPSVSANLLQLSANSTFTIRGFSASYAYAKFTILNTSSTANINIARLNQNSASANQISTPDGAGIILVPADQADFVYDNNISKWLVTKRGVPSNIRPAVNSYSGAGSVAASGVNNIVIVSQDTYDNINIDPNTVYVIPSGS